jgi:hypothetical protein
MNGTIVLRRACNGPTMKIRLLAWVPLTMILSLGFIACTAGLQSTSGQKAASGTYAVTVACPGCGSRETKGLTDTAVKSVWIQINDKTTGVSVGSGNLTNSAGSWHSSIDISKTGDLTFTAIAYDSLDTSGTKLYYGKKDQGVSGSGDIVTIDVSTLYLSYLDTAPVSIMTTDPMVPAGQTMIVDASALTGSNTFTWNGSAESDGSFSITAGSSNATITGGSGNDTIAVGTGTNWIDGKAGNNTITLSAAGGTDTIIFSSLGVNDTDSISNFIWSADMLKLIANCDGGHYITTAATGVSSGTTSTWTIAAGHIDGDTANPIVLIALANSIASDAALVTSLASGGTNQLTLANIASAGSDLLVLYSDGTDAHLVTVRLNTVAISFISGEMTVIDMASLKGVGSLAGWSYIPFLIG